MMKHAARMKKTFLLLALAVCVVFSVGFAENLAANSLDHDCCKKEEKGCLPCLKIETARRFLRILKFAIFAMFFAAHLLFYAQAPEKHAEYNTCFLSPITLKVRFNT
jgi:hypothetical protein